MVAMGPRHGTTGSTGTLLSVWCHWHHRYQWNGGIIATGTSGTLDTIDNVVLWYHSLTGQHYHGTLMTLLQWHPCTMPSWLPWENDFWKIVYGKLLLKNDLWNFPFLV